MTSPSIRDAARAYLARGWTVIPVPFQSKQPSFDDWQHARITIDELDARFPHPQMNVSVLPGAPSGGLADVDLDVALAVVLADRLLPATPAVFGRVSRPRSHRLYQLTGSATSKTWKDPTVAERDERAMLLELRVSGHTLFPGSTHPSGEAVAWDSAGDPAAIDADVLRSALSRLAAATLLARHWPGPGGRHHAALALSGGLLRAGWTVEITRQFLEAVVTAAGDDEVADRLRTVDDSATALAAGDPVTGWPTLTEIIDPRVVAAIQK